MANNSSSSIDIANALINNTEFIQAIRRIIQTNDVSNPSSSSTTSTPPTTNSTSRPTPTPQRPSLSSALSGYDNINEEQQSLFSSTRIRGRRGSFSPYAIPTPSRGVIQMQRTSTSAGGTITNSSVPASRATTAGHHQQGSSSKNRRTSNKRPYTLKEVVLLPDPAIETTPRAPKKAEFVAQGLMMSNVQIERYWNNEALVNYLESLFLEKLNIVEWHDQEKKFAIMIGIGQNLVHSCLPENQELDAEALHRLFVNKIVWMRANKSIENNSSYMDVPDMQTNITDFYESDSASTDRRNDSNFNNDAAGPSHSDILIRVDDGYEEPFQNNADTLNKMKNMFPKLSERHLIKLISRVKSWDEAVEALNFEDANDVIEFYKNMNQVDSKNFLDISRENIWRESLRFYKVCSVDTRDFYKKLVIKFDTEDGIDAGALSIAFFEKLFHLAKKELFEMTPDENAYIPKRSGGNLSLFKVFGLAIAHSLLNDGPCFSVLPDWCFLSLIGESDDIVMASLTDKSYKDSIPLNAASATVIELLDLLNQAETKDDIYKIFDGENGQTYEQIVSSTQWPVDQVYSMENIEMLKQMIIWEELVQKREKQIKAIREGLAAANFMDILVGNSQLLKNCFVANVESIVTKEKLIECIEWDSIGNVPVKEYLKTYIESANSCRLSKILEFSTAYTSFSSVRKFKISLKLLPSNQEYPQSNTCFKSLSLPTQHTSYQLFRIPFEKALDFASEGFGQF